MRVLPRVNAYMAKSIAQTSKIFVAIATLRLLKRSARNPPAIENKRKGSAKRFPTTKTRKSFCEAVGLVPKIRKITKNFSPLSLKAPWNCVAIRLQKPRRQLGFASDVARFPSGMPGHPSWNWKLKDGTLLAVYPGTLRRNYWPIHLCRKRDFSSHTARISNRPLGGATERGVGEAVERE